LTKILLKFNLIIQTDIMKKLFFLFSFLITTSLLFAERYFKAKIIMQDGTELNGLATTPVMPEAMLISFKENKDDKHRSIKPADIKTIIYFYENDNKVEYDRVLFYLYKSDKKPTIGLFRVYKRGKVTLYTYSMGGFGDNGGATYSSRHPSVDFWACIRSGEETATNIANSESKNKRDVFVERASEYFKDDRELVAKIADKTYKWDDVEKIVDEYNAKK
jgi:hypothetical protein